MRMASYGDIVRCPACDIEHTIRVGEINAREQIEFSCSHCGWRVSMEHDGSKASAARFERRAIPNLDSTRGGRSPGARSSRPMR